MHVKDFDLLLKSGDMKSCMQTELQCGSSKGNMDTRGVLGLFICKTLTYYR